MSRNPGTELRQAVASRADRLCEYCLIHEDDTFYGCEVDHIVSVKHGGETSRDNLAYACVFCNRHKGSDLGSIDPDTEELVRFFNPRRDQWGYHFRLVGVEIIPSTAIGRVTARILQLNDVRRLMERRALHAVDRYPTPAA